MAEIGGSYILAAAAGRRPPSPASPIAGTGSFFSHGWRTVVWMEKVGDRSG
jgi:hypothetical protein